MPPTCSASSSYTTSLAHPWSAAVTPVPRAAATAAHKTTVDDHDSCSCSSTLILHPTTFIERQTGIIYYLQAAAN